MLRRRERQLDAMRQAWARFAEAFNGTAAEPLPAGGKQEAERRDDQTAPASAEGLPPWANGIGSEPQRNMFLALWSKQGQEVPVEEMGFWIYRERPSKETDRLRKLRYRLADTLRELRQPYKITCRRGLFYSMRELPRLK